MCLFNFNVVYHIINGDRDFIIVNNLNKIIARFVKGWSVRNGARVESHKPLDLDVDIWKVIGSWQSIIHSASRYQLQWGTGVCLKTKISHEVVSSAQVCSTHQQHHCQLNSLAWIDSVAERWYQISFGIPEPIRIHMNRILDENNQCDDCEIEIRVNWTWFRSSHSTHWHLIIIAYFVVPFDGRWISSTGHLSVTICVSLNSYALTVNIKPITRCDCQSSVNAIALDPLHSFRIDEFHQF